MAVRRCHGGREGRIPRPKPLLREVSSFENTYRCSDVSRMFLRRRQVIEPFEQAILLNHITDGPRIDTLREERGLTGRESVHVARGDVNKLVDVL